MTQKTGVMAAENSALLSKEYILNSGATDHKTHGSDHTTDFESRIG